MFTSESQGIFKTLFLAFDNVIAGIDEAGRGPVVGPLVIALVEGCQEDLKGIGVKDSKELSPQKRERLFEEICNLCNVIYIRVEPFVVDLYVMENSLNVLEAEIMTSLTQSARAEKIYIDAPDVDARRFSELIARKTGKKVIAEHGADKKYPIVSAASIVAKVIRDRIIRGISEVYGRVGSGYPHDSTTIKFVEGWIRRMGRVPSFVRGSWATVRRIVQKNSQKTLEDYLF